MPRRPYEGSDMLPGMDPDSRRVERPRIRAASPPPPKPVPRLKIAFRVIAGTLVLIGGLYAFHRWEQFLIRDPRFALNGPDGSADTPTLEIQGAAHASRRAIRSVFDDD